MQCETCKQEVPSVSLVHELIKANNAYGKLSERFELLHNFVKQIIKDWECDPNHAESILSELHRMSQ